MIPLEIHVDGDGAWPDMKDKEVIETQLRGIAALSDGMNSGRASVGLRIDLPDGRVVFAQTSMRLFLNAAKVFMVKYGHELEGPA